MGQPGNAYLSRLGYSTFWHNSYNLSKKNSTNIFNRSFIVKAFNYIFTYSFIRLYNYYSFKKFTTIKNFSKGYRFFRKKEVVNKHINLTANLILRNNVRKHDNYTKVKVVSSSDWVFLIWYTIKRHDFTGKFSKKIIRLTKIKTYNKFKNLSSLYRKYNLLKYLLKGLISKKKLKLHLI